MWPRLTFVATMVCAGTLVGSAPWSHSAETERQGTVSQGPRKRVHRRASSAAQPQNAALYSEAVSYGNLLFIAGRGAGGNFEGGIKGQTTRALDRLEDALKMAGSSMEKVLKVNVYLANPKDFPAMNEVYQGRFGSEPPVRTTITGTGIPDGSLVEIDCVAYLSTN